MHTSWSLRNGGGWHPVDVTLILPTRALRWICAYPAENFLNCRVTWRRWRRARR